MAISPYSSLRNPLLEESASHRAIENQKDMFNLLGGGEGETRSPDGRD